MEKTIIKKIAQKKWKNITLEEKKKYIDILFKGNMVTTIKLIYDACDCSKERGKYGKDDLEIREYIKFKENETKSNNIL